MIHGCSGVATGDSGTASLQRILGSSRGSPLGTLLGTEGDHCGASEIATWEASGTWGNSWFSTGDAGVVTRDVGVTIGDGENLRVATGTWALPGVAGMSPGMRVSQPGKLEDEEKQSPPQNPTSVSAGLDLFPPSQLFSKLASSF